MSMMAEYFNKDGKSVNLKENDIFAKLKISPQTSFKEFYERSGAKEPIDESHLVFPTFANYKQVSLD